MNLKLVLPFVCAASLAVGWMIGSTFSDHPKPSTAGADGGKNPSALSSASRELPPTTEDEEKQREQILLGALREPNELRRARDLYDAISKMSPGEVSSAIALAQRMSGKDRDALLPMLVGKWAETNPQAALEFALGLERTVSSDVIRTASNTWLAADQEGALAWARSLPAGGLRDAALSILTSALGKRDPDAAVQFIGTLPYQFTDRDFGRFIGEWAQLNPAAVGRQALMLPQGPNRDNAIHITLWHWAANDPQAALAWAEQLQDERELRKALTLAYERWGDTDPQAASVAALALRPGDLRNLAIETVARSLVDRGMPTALQLIEQMPFGVARHGAVQNLARNWAFRDPQAAAQYVSSLPSGDLRNDGISEVAYTWARRDAKAAFAWVSGLSEGEKKDAQHAVVMGLSREDPRAAADYLIREQNVSADDGVNSRSTLIAILEDWARNDSQSSLAWVWQIGDENFRNSLLGPLIREIAETDPQQAAQLLSQLPDNKRSDATGVVADLWARSDAATAAAWAMQLSEGDTRDRAVRNVVERWAAEDLITTARWLETLPDGTSRDAAVAAFTSSAAGTDPERAAAWATKITDPKMRNAEVERVIGKWRIKDKAAATLWVTQSPALDDTTKQRLLRGN